MPRFMHPQHALAVSFVPRRQRPNQSLERTAAPLAGHGGSRSATVTGLGGRLARAAVAQFCRQAERVVWQNEVGSRIQGLLRMPHDK